MKRSPKYTLCGCPDASKNIVIALLFSFATMVGCNREAIGVSDAAEADGSAIDMMAVDAAIIADDADCQRHGGKLPPGFDARGCQWDNPACGQPTPGGHHDEPMPEDR